MHVRFCPSNSALFLTALIDTSRHSGARPAMRAATPRESAAVAAAKMFPSLPSIAKHRNVACPLLDPYSKAPVFTKTLVAPTHTSSITLPPQEQKRFLPALTGTRSTGGEFSDSESEKRVFFSPFNSLLFCTELVERVCMPGRGP